MIIYLGSKGLIGGLGEERLLLKDGEEGHRLLKHVDAFLEIHPKVNVGPVKTLSHVFLLLESEPESALLIHLKIGSWGQTTCAG